jgi:uncharacterized protein YrrD
VKSVNLLKNFSLQAQDGELGKVRDVYFDDRQWAIRYLVVDTGNWLTGRTVLISPIAVQGLLENELKVDVNLTRAQVQNSPDVSTDEPLARQHEVQLSEYYNWPYYWDGTGVWGAGMFPYGITNVPMRAVPPSDKPIELAQSYPTQIEEIHLRSADEIIGYGIQATDGDIGHVEDFLFDDKNWTIQTLVADTAPLWFGKKVLVSLDRIERMDWTEKRVELALTREALKDLATFEPQTTFVV